MLLVLFACVPGTAREVPERDSALEQVDSGSGRDSEAADSADDTGDSAPAATDDDGDGYPAAFDCNDADPTINPMALEVCDRIDNDCDGMADEGLPLAEYWTDADGDGWGAIEAPTVSCGMTGGVRASGDCDDADAQIGRVMYWFTDADGDSYGDMSTVTASCLPPTADSVADGTDCDDADPTIWRVAEWFPDADGDGFGEEGAGVYGCSAPAGDSTPVGGDCDDTEVTVNPGALDACTLVDGIDNDCSGTLEDENCYTGFGVSHIAMSGWDCEDVLTITGSAQSSGVPSGLELAWDASFSSGDCWLADTTVTFGYDFDQPDLLFYGHGGTWTVLGDADYDPAHSVLQVRISVDEGYEAPSRSGGDVDYDFAGRFVLPPP